MSKISKANLNRLEGKVDMILEYQAKQDGLLQLYDGRIRSLENSRSKILGWVACIGTIISFVVTALIDIFTKGGTHG